MTKDASIIVESPPPSVVQDRFPKSMQIIAIGLYNGKGEVRSLNFKVGCVNIITGASKTGKSALIDIVDYCLGRSEYTVPSGIIRDTVVWYVLQLRLPGTQVIIGRPALHDSNTSSAVYLSVGGDLSLPELSDLRPNSNTTALEQFLTERIGITANESAVTKDRTSLPLQANIKHARFLLYQPQSRIADRNLMFYRQEEQFVPQAIKDSLPYFFGATGDERYSQLLELRRLRRELKVLERQSADEMSVRGRDNSRALALLAEAGNVGLSFSEVESDDFSAMLLLLEDVAARTPEVVSGDLGDRLEVMQSQRDDLLTQGRGVQNEIDSARSFSLAQNAFSAEASEQRSRLSAINLFSDEPNEQRCPLCESDLSRTMPTATQVRANLASLEHQINATTRQRPRLDAFVAEREAQLANIRIRLAENKASIEALIAQEEALQRERGRMTEQSRVLGRISLFLESVERTGPESSLQQKLAALRQSVEGLEQELLDDSVEDRLASVLQSIAIDMSAWAKVLMLEHSEWPVTFEVKNLTVVAHRDTGPIRLHQMGSGENWMGYHVITHLAIHKLFLLRNRPVPGVIFFDQPTQVYFPPEASEDHSLEELEDDDMQAVKRLFRLIFDVVNELAPDLQVIITDHADLNESWFQDAIVEKWRNGVKLVPVTWLESSAPQSRDE